MRRRAAALILTLATLGFAVPSTVEAAFLGDNGPVAFTKKMEFSGDREIYTVSPTGTQTNLTDPTSTPCFEDPCQHDDSPSFSADGNRIVFASDRDGNFEIYVMNANGSNPTRLTNTPDVAEATPAFSPNGDQIVYETDRPQAMDPTKREGDIYLMNADGSDPTNLTPDVGSNDRDPAFSPDGNWIAFEAYRVEEIRLSGDDRR